jgi:hypothetical protein
MSTQGDPGQGLDTNAPLAPPDAENLVVRGATHAIEIAAERYVQTSGARALVSLIPGVGGALDALIGGEGARIQERRVAQLIGNLRLDMALIEAGMLDEQFIHSEEFYDWFVATGEKVVRTNDEEKLRALRNVFMNGVVAGNDDGSLKNLILSVVGDLTGDHVRVLRVMHEIEPPTESGDVLPALDQFPPIEDLRIKFTEFDTAKFDAIVNDLIRAGLLAPYLATTYGGGTGSPTAVTLSLFGREVVRFLSAPTRSD